MQSLTLRRGILVTAAVFGPLFACSSSTPGATDGGTADGSTTTPDGGTTTPDGATGYKECPTAGTTCTKAEEEAYGACVLGKCETQYAKCLGSGYKTGNFAGGACATFIACTQKCGCNDTACYTACGQPDATCTACFTEIGTCVQSSGCKAPACMTPDAGVPPADGGGGDCTALAACCAQITDAQIQQGCTTIASSGNGTSCGQALAGYKGAGLCN